MQERNKIESILTRNELLFFTAYVIWLIMAVIKLTYLKDLFEYKTVYELVEKAVLVLLVLKFIDDKRYTLKDVVGIVSILLCYYISVQAEAKNFMIPIYFIFSARNISYKKILKVSFSIQMSIMSVAVVTSLLGIIPNEVWDADTRARYSLGYTFCTYGSHISFFCTLIYLSLRKKIYLMEMITLIGWNVLWYWVTNTRIDLLLCVPAILFVYFWKKSKSDLTNNIVVDLFFLLIGPSIAVFMFVLQKFYNDENFFCSLLNRALNGRLWYGWQAIKTYGITMWGQAVKWVGRGGIKKNADWVYNYVDCSYVKYLLNYGLVFFVLLLIGIIIAGKYVKNTRNKGIIVAYVFWLLYGMIDAELFELAFQPFMLLISMGWNDISKQDIVLKWREK